MADDGHYFFCKEDLDGHPVRASEWLATRLAARVGIAAADCAVMTDDDGETYFASKLVPSMADRVILDQFLMTPRPNELGQPGNWPGEYLAMLRAFDQFVDNPDRGNDNFILSREGARTNLCAIDFGSAHLIRGSIDQFPVESDRTMLVGKLHQRIHGVHINAAMEMLGRIAVIPAAAVETIVTEMPESWLSERQRGNLYDFWSSDRREKRIATLRAALTG